MLQGHAYSGVPGVEFSTGSLGHGLSVANGMALAGKINKADYNVYCLLGDGELQEGSVWEAAMTAAQHRLGNVCAIIDRNRIQQNDRVSAIKNEEPLAEKWKAFGWNVIEADGHVFEELIKALDSFGDTAGKPHLIIANTVKGKGVYQLVHFLDDEGVERIMLFPAKRLEFFVNFVQFAVLPVRVVMKKTRVAGPGFIREQRHLFECGMPPAVPLFVFFIRVLGVMHQVSGPAAEIDDLFHAGTGLIHQQFVVRYENEGFTGFLETQSRGVDGMVQLYGLDSITVHVKPQVAFFLQVDG